MGRKQKSLQTSHKLYKPLGRFNRNPGRLITLSFLAVILTGALLLTMPFSSRDGQTTPFLAALFTATSATCVTGLTIYDTWSHFSMIGQGIIICLIQIGGLGLLTLTGFFYSLIRRKVGLRTAQLTQESISADTRSNTQSLLRMVMIVTFTTELIGCLLMLPMLVPEYGNYGIFMAVFLSISAYCNAGFDLFGFLKPGASLIPVQDNFPLLAVISALIICGGLGFIVWQDVLHYRRSRRLHFHTRTVLLSTAVLLVSGTLLTLLMEWGNPATLGNMGVGEKFAHAFFQSVTCRTAGFMSFDQTAMYDVTKIVSVLLMFIGAAPGSTGGGIKLTTALILFMTVISVIRGEEDTTVIRRRIDKSIVYRSLAVAFLAACMVMFTTLVLLVTSDVSTVDALYEAVSAFGTVGLSVGVTNETNWIGHLALIFTMFFGRIGPVAFALSLSMRPKSPASRLRQEPEGKIWVA